MLFDAILWRWPGARCVVSGDTLTRWDGPGDRPSDAAIAQAVADYAALPPQSRVPLAAKASALDNKAIRAVARALHRRLEQPDAMTAREWDDAIQQEFEAL